MASKRDPANESDCIIRGWEFNNIYIIRPERFDKSKK